jgi:protocatechuate 3,4-dioxygenase beta subunit
MAQRLWLVGAILLIAFALREPASAGTTGALSGHVFDMNGQPLRGATVQIAQILDFREITRNVDMQRAVFDTRITDANGFFVFVSLDPGFYAVRPVAAGHYFYCLPRVFIEADQESFIDFAMSDFEILVRCPPINYIGPP